MVRDCTYCDKSKRTGGVLRDCTDTVTNLRGQVVTVPAL